MNVMHLPSEVKVIEICDNEAWLLPEKAVFFPGLELLALADLHIGKAAHFRKHGMAVSRGIFEKDLFNLKLLMEKYHPDRVYFIGDLFHSDDNRECGEFLEWTGRFPEVAMTLVPGNHDILPPALLKEAHFTISPGELTEAGITFRHHPPEEVTEGCYHLCGHIHPAVTLGGKARQYITAPCFYFTGHYGILPSFGSLTGHVSLRRKAGDKVYAVTPGRVWEIPG